MVPDRKFRIFIYARITVSLFFLGSAVFFYRTPEAGDHLVSSGLIWLMAASFFFSIISYSILKRFSRPEFTTFLQVLWDLLFVTLLLLFTGGATSPYPFLYLLSIMNAGILLGRREALTTASLCSLIYATLIALQYAGKFESIGLSSADAQAVGSSRLIYSVLMYLVGFVVTALTTGYLAERARTSEEELRERTIDYQDLSSLHSAIVSRIDIGLVTTDQAGCIRFFNPHAEELTGISSEQAYGRDVHALFPGLQSSDCQGGESCRGEMTYHATSMHPRTFGYTFSPLSGRGGESAGMLLCFTDLTVLKNMEAVLKRSDRLIALGELSARMAHEIRNPLAAMSGSIQLLKDQVTSRNEQRLMEIVMREADRLNALIGEFLAYARPAQPRKVRIELRGLVEELRLLLISDKRFSGITIRNLIAEHFMITADESLLRQVLINLLNNAAEAMNSGGWIEVESRHQLRDTDGHEAVPMAVVEVNDNGPGIAPEMAEHLFEPFWTSKSDGTGLGLAVSYRLVEAHGGMISAGRSEAGGSSFKIFLPV